ncbi:guanine nucleotide-binding protein subunit gamma [Syncephalis plumigaleata]|nr:guanine nucleotide-binding protein subunit gamma [Syncephalis plumigaleata]
MSHQSHRRDRATVSELKLKKLMENNRRLQHLLDMPRIPVSEASISLFDSSIWGTVNRKDDPYAPQGSNCGPCTIV